jgi:hypothetical protein
MPYGLPGDRCGPFRDGLAAAASNGSRRRRLSLLFDDGQIFGGRFAVLSGLKIIGDLLPFAQ